MDLVFAGEKSIQRRDPAPSERYQIMVQLTAERADGPRVIWSGHDWQDCKEKMNFWANEYRESMDSISIRVRDKP